MITPRRQDGFMDQRGAMSEQTLHRGLQVWHLQRKADRPADTFSRFELVDDLGLSFVEQLEGGPAHIEDKRFAAIVVPNGSGFDSESITVEFHQAFIITGCERDA